MFFFVENEVELFHETTWIRFDFICFGVRKPNTWHNFTSILQMLDQNYFLMPSKSNP